MQAIDKLIQTKKQSHIAKPLTIPKSNKVKSNRQLYDTKPRAVTARDTIPTTGLSFSMRERLKKYYS